MASDSVSQTSEKEFKVCLRDHNEDLTSAWEEVTAFGNDRYKGLVEVSRGDIFTEAPAVDAIVSPANSFGFMDGGIDMVYSLHFGWQLQERLQKLLRSKHCGELPVGCAVILPTYPPEQEPAEGSPNIRYLISAPTMRIPLDVSQTVNAYLAFRAVLLAVKEHNCACSPEERIRSFLCPGLGTAVGCMPVQKCAYQMKVAYEAVMFGDVKGINAPPNLSYCWENHKHLAEGGNFQEDDSSDGET